jgi:hypothetical protein
MVSLIASLASAHSNCRLGRRQTRPANSPERNGNLDGPFHIVLSLEPTTAPRAVKLDLQPTTRQIRQMNLKFQVDFSLEDAILHAPCARPTLITRCRPN